MVNNDLPSGTCTILKGHEGPVYCGAFDGSGMYVLTGGHDRQINLFNLQTGSLISTYSGHAWPVYDLAISHTGGNFLSGGGDKAVFLWDALSHRTIRKLTGHIQRINAVCFGGEDSIAASASYDRSVRLWDLKSSGRFPIQILEESRDSITSVQINGVVIITGSVDGHVRQYDLRKATLLVDNVQEAVTCVTFTEDRLAFLATCLDSTIRLFDSSGALLNEFEGHVNTRYKIKSTFFKNDAFVVSGSETGELFMWDLVTAKVVKKLVAHDQTITSAAAHMEKLLTCSLDGTSAIWIE